MLAFLCTLYSMFILAILICAIVSRIKKDTFYVKVILNFVGVSSAIIAVMAAVGGIIYFWTKVVFKLT